MSLTKSDKTSKFMSGKSLQNLSSIIKIKISSGKKFWNPRKLKRSPNLANIYAPVK